MESVLAQLYARADYDMSVAERGIVYIDEIDKVQNIPRIPHHYLLRLLLVKRFLYLPPPLFSDCSKVNRVNRVAGCVR